MTKHQITNDQAPMTSDPNRPVWSLVLGAWSFRAAVFGHWSLVIGHLRPIRPRTSQSARRGGLSLLEVILAIAILGGALAIIGELIRIGARNAAIARDLTTAQLYCESKMSEAAAGVIDLENLATEELDEEGEWMCVITTEALDQQQLIAVNVTVGQNPDLFARPVSFSMTRWIVDPSYVAQCAALDAQLKAEAKQRVANAAQTAGGSGGAATVEDLSGEAGGGETGGGETGGGATGGGAAGGGFGGTAGGFGGGFGGAQGGGPGSRGGQGGGSGDQGAFPGNADRPTRPTTPTDRPTDFRPRPR